MDRRQRMYAQMIYKDYADYQIIEAYPNTNVIRLPVMGHGWQVEYEDIKLNTYALKGKRRIGKIRIGQSIKLRTIVVGPAKSEPTLA